MLLWIEEDLDWLYFSQSLIGWMCRVCKMYQYSTGPLMGAFSTRPCKNISHPSHAFKQHKSSAHHKWLEIKLTDNSVSVYQQMVPGFEKFNLYKKIPTYCTCVNASIQKTTWSKNLALMDSYGDHSVLQGSNHPWKIDPLNRNPLWL